MSFLTKIPDEITLFYLFIITLITTIMPVDFGNIPLIIGLVIAIIPLFRKIMYPEITIAFDKIGDGYRVELIPTKKVKKKNEEFVDYNGIVKEYPRNSLTYFVKKNITTLFNNVARFVYKDGNKIGVLKRIDLDNTKASFLTENEKEEELRLMRKRDE